MHPQTQFLRQRKAICTNAYYRQLSALSSPLQLNTTAHMGMRVLSNNKCVLGTTKPPHGQ